MRSGRSAHVHEARANTIVPDVYCVVPRPVDGLHAPDKILDPRHAEFNSPIGLLRGKRRHLRVAWAVTERIADEGKKFL